jgi:glycerol-3-phosphate dehydrogenase (NAD(P)+)
MVVEGVNATSAVYEMSKKLGVDMPIVSAAYSVLYGGKNPKQVVTELMCRENKSEII